jgi:hypothetical protein
MDGFDQNLAGKEVTAVCSRSSCGQRSSSGVWATAHSREDVARCGDDCGGEGLLQRTSRQSDFAEDEKQRRPVLRELGGWKLGERWGGRGGQARGEVDRELSVPCNKRGHAACSYMARTPRGIAAAALA